MNKIYLILILMMSSFYCFGQNGDLQKAIKSGKNSELYYQANFKKIYKVEKIKKWCKSNNYVLISFIEGEVARFGGYERGITGARFMTQRDYAYVVEQERKRQIALAEARKNAAEANRWRTLKNVAIAAMAVKGAWEGGKWVADKMFSGSSDDYSYTQPTNSIQITKYSDWKSTSTFSSDTEHCEGCMKRKVYYKCGGDIWSAWYVKTPYGYKSGTNVPTNENGLMSKHKYKTEQDCVNAIVEWQCN